MCDEAKQAKDMSVGYCNKKKNCKIDVGEHFKDGKFEVRNLSDIGRYNDVASNIGELFHVHTNSSNTNTLNNDAYLNNHTKA